MPSGILGLRTFDPLELAVDEAPLAPLLAVLALVAEVPATFLTGRTGRSSQPQPEVMAIRTIKGPKAIVIFMAATTKVEIEDVEFMVMGLILNNWLLVKVSKVGGWRVGAFNLSNYTPTDYDLAILLGKSSQQKLPLILPRVFSRFLCHLT